MLTDDQRSDLGERLTTGALELVAGCGPKVEVQLFGFGVRLVPPDGAALLSVFLVPDRDDMFVLVDLDELSWDIDATAPDAVEQVMALLQAGVAGRMTVHTGPRARRVTATLDDGRILETTRSRSSFRRPLRSRLGPGTRTAAPYPVGAGPARVRDVARPPALLTDIGSGVAPAVAAHGCRALPSFEVAGIHGIPHDQGGYRFGWGIDITRPDGTTVAWTWFDGYDRDLAVLVDDTHWFEWRDLDDQDAVRTEAVEVVRAALDGRVVRGPRRTASVLLPDGRRVTTEPPPPDAG